MDEHMPLNPMLSRRDLLKGAAILGGALAISPSLLACGGGSSTDTSPSAGASAAPKKGGILTVAVSDAFTGESIDPGQAITGFGSFFGTCVYDTLMQVTFPGWVAKPLLAESLEASADGTKWQAKLRSGVVFHDGSPLTAKDVVYSLQRLYDSKLGSGALALLAPILAQSGIKAVDDTTVVFELEKPFFWFDVVLGDKATAIVKEGTTPSTVAGAIGTGPFKAVSWTDGESWEVARNADYWQSGLPYLDSVRSVVNYDLTAKYQGVLTGQYSVCDEIAFSTAASLLDSDKANVYLAKSTGIARYLAMSGRSKPFDDVDVRNAFKLAMNREAATETVLAGLGQATSDLPMIPDDPWYPPDLALRPYDPEKAKSTLAAAGYADGIDAELFTSTVAAGLTELAVAYKEYAAPAGIRIKVNQWSPSTYWSKVWMQKPFYSSILTAYFPPFLVLNRWNTECPYNEGILDPTFDELAAKAAASPDPAMQQKYIHEAMVLESETGGWICPAAVESPWLTATEVKGLQEAYSTASLSVREAWLA